MGAEVVPAGGPPGLTPENVPLSGVSELADLAGAARDYIAASKAPATLRAYRSDWRMFESWCRHRGLDALPAEPETLALWLTDLAGRLACSTIQRRIVSINQAHKAAGYDAPSSAAIVRETWRGIRRTWGTAQRGKAPVVTTALRAMVATLDVGRLLGIRDRALLVVDFAGAFRRSELVAQDVDDVVETTDGLEVLIRRSKTDQEGEGETVGLPYGSDPATCPVRTYRAWLEASGITEGAIWRPINRWDAMADRRLSAEAVADVVKRTAAAAGYDAAAYAAHSMRSGLITSAARAGVAERDIMRHTRHKSVATMRRYIRRATVFSDNAAVAVGL